MAIYNVISTLPDQKYIDALERWIRWAELRIQQLEQEVKNK